jgi:hypothetical protein
MLKINTTQYGPVTVVFKHSTTCPEKEFKGRLYKSLKDSNPSMTREELWEEVNDQCVNILVILKATNSDVVVNKMGTPHTEANIRIESNPETKYFGRSYVNRAAGDQFKKEEGRLIAMNRAIENLPNVTDKTRREILAGYFNR